MLIYLEGFDLFLNLANITNIKIIKYTDGTSKLEYYSIRDQCYSHDCNLTMEQYSNNLYKLKHLNDK